MLQASSPANIDIKNGQQTVLPHGTENILLVDDEEDLVDIGGQMLGALGYDVTCVVGSMKPLAMNILAESVRKVLDES